MECITPLYTAVVSVHPYAFIISALLFSPPYSRNSDPGLHSRLFPPPPHYGSCLAFYREEISALSSLVDSRRIALTHARRSQQLVLFFRTNKLKISPRRDSNSRTNTSSI